MRYDFGLSLEELEKRTSKDYLLTKHMLDVDAVEYTALSDGDKTALSYLVKVARIIEKINMQLDSSHNLPFQKFLDEEIKKAQKTGDKRAELTKILFDAQKGIFALDCESNLVKLAANLEKRAGRGLYPDDLDKEEFHKILINMIKAGKIPLVKQILNQRSVVERNKFKKDELVAIDYVDKFADDFKKIAELLLRASCVSTNVEFNEYLRLQSQAFLVADPMLDAYADKKWASLQDTPLEFTITRENYSDETVSLLEQTAIVYLKDEYTKIGIDVEEMQIGYIATTGLKMLGLALASMVLTIASASKP